jgi:large subunit ribosomal protein L26e
MLIFLVVLTIHNNQVRSVPIHKDDEVLIIRGEQKGREGKVVSVYRKKYKVHVEKISIDKINGMLRVDALVRLCSRTGQTVFIPIDASNCIITKLKMNNSRKSLLDRKAEGRTKGAKGEGKFSEETTMSKVD